MLGRSVTQATGGKRPVHRPPQRRAHHASPLPAAPTGAPTTSSSSPGLVFDLVDEVDRVELGRHWLLPGPEPATSPPAYPGSSHHRPAGPPDDSRGSSSSPAIHRRTVHLERGDHARVPRSGALGDRFGLTGSFALPWSCCLAAPRQKGGTAPGACNGGSVPRSLRSLLYSPSLRADRCIPP